MVSTFGTFVHDACGATQSIPSLPHRDGVGYCCGWCDIPVPAGQVQRAVARELARQRVERENASRDARERLLR